VFLAVAALLIEKIDWPVVKKKLKKVLVSKETATLVIVLFACFVMTVGYLIRLPHTNASVRIQEFSVFNPDELSAQVNNDRRLSLASPLLNIFSNKYQATLNVVLKRFISAYDLRWIFLHGNEAIDTFIVTDAGFLYLADFLLLMVGIIFICSNRKRAASAIFFVGLLFAGSLTMIVRTGPPWITFRAAFIFLDMVMFAGIGTGYILSRIPKNFRAAFILLYLLGTCSFFLHLLFSLSTHSDSESILL
jgi:hypothetical protein